MRRLLRFAAPALGLALLAPALRADDPPTIEHQPVPCSVPGKAISLCAAIADDAMVAKARVYFRPPEDKFFSYVEMVFGGITWCATLPAPREGKLKAVEYYLQAFDDQYQAMRTSTYQMQVQPEAACAFPAVEQDAARAAAIRVFATSPKQGKKLPDEFHPTGVSFVGVGR